MADFINEMMMASMLMPPMLPWLAARITNGRTVWSGYFLGVVIVIGLILFAGASGAIRGERLAVTFAVFAIGIGPLSVLVGALSAVICRFAYKKRGKSNAGEAN